MQVTIEGVVNSDVIRQGERRTIELTPYIRGLLGARLVRQVPFDPPEQSADTAATESDAAGDADPEVAEAPAPRRRRRGDRPAEEE